MQSKRYARVFSLLEAELTAAVLEKMVAMGCGVEEAELDGEEAEKVA
jgi:hypothetical protein